MARKQQVRKKRGRHTFIQNKNVLRVEWREIRYKMHINNTENTGIVCIPKRATERDKQRNVSRSHQRTTFPNWKI